MEKLTSENIVYMYNEHERKNKKDLTFARKEWVTVDDLIKWLAEKRKQEEHNLVPNPKRLLNELDTLFKTKEKE